MGILFAHIRFMKALEVQGISRDTLPYKAWGQPYLAWTAFCITAVVTFFKGFDVFIHGFNYKSFITNYVSGALAPATCSARYLLAFIQIGIPVVRRGVLSDLYSLEKR